MKTKHLPWNTILMVDDQEDNLRVLAGILSSSGYDLIPAMSGSQALERLAHSKPDLILLDVMLPDIDGVDVCRKIMADPQLSDIPVIFVSAADDKEMVVAALESGGMDYITKPFDRNELLIRVKTHLALKEARDRLKDLAADKDELLGLLAHDFKNQIAGIQMSASLLAARKEQEWNERSQRLIDQIVHTSDRVMDFIRRFLSNQASLGITLEAVNADLMEIAEAVVHEAEPAATRKGIELVLEKPEGATAARVDLTATHTVIENLVSNAVKFCPAGARVSLTAQRLDNGGIALYVRDSGPGFSEEDRRSLFSRYARLSSRPTGGETSTGLGLYIVKKLMEGQGGSIELVSAPSQGASFILKFPPPARDTNPNPQSN